MNKRFVLILAAFVVLFGALLVFGKKDNQGSNGDTGNNNSSAQLSEHKVGSGTSGVTLLEYGDFECPACGQYYPIVESVKQKYGDQITFQFRHFPLTEIHKNALISSRAAEAAAKQNKFWEMYSILYERQQNWKNSANASVDFEGYAKELGLDVEKFKTDMKSEEINDIVQADRSEAKKQGYSSTPTFVLNGKKIEQSPRSVEEFYKLIDEAIASKQNNQ